jgi:ferredoxin
MKMHIDWTACDGRGLCAELLPEMLTSDDWGYPVARGSLGVPEEWESAARRAVDRCPALALRLVPRS